MFKKIKKNIKKEAEEKLEPLLPIDEQQLHLMLKEILDNYVNVISNNDIIRDSSLLKEKLLKELKSNWMTIYHDYVEKNEDITEEFC